MENTTSGERCELLKNMLGNFALHEKWKSVRTFGVAKSQILREKFEKLTDSQWEVMADFLPVQRKRNLDLREVVVSIRWVSEVEGQWRNLPDFFPAWDAVYYYFRR